MKTTPRPLVLVHGLWDRPELFNKLIIRLETKGVFCFAPHLPHKLGRVSLHALAQELDRQILFNFGPEQTIDLLGFSMGGIVSRTWLQNFGGVDRTNSFFSIGSPHNGTFTAQIIPSKLFLGIAQMKIGSKFLLELNRSCSCLKKINCTSFFCLWDLMVFPGWSGVLPCGSIHSVPVISHKGLISSEKSIDLLEKKILGNRIKTRMANQCFCSGISTAEGFEDLLG